MDKFEGTSCSTEQSQESSEDVSAIGPLSSCYSLDEFLDNRHKFVGKLVCVSGKLVRARVGPGILTSPVRLNMQGNKNRIELYSEINRVKQEELGAYLEAYLGRSVGVRMFANTGEFDRLLLEDKTILMDY